MQHTKHFILWLYGALYLATAIALVTIAYTSVRIGWPWLSTLVEPMGIVFLCINIPLASFAILKIGHVLYLHSVQHHTNVMRSIREKDIAFNTSLPYQVSTPPQNNMQVSQVSQGSGTSVPLLSGTTLSQNVPMSQGVKNDNKLVAEYLTDNPGATIRDVESGTGVSKSNVGRTYAWQNRSKP